MRTLLWRRLPSVAFVLVVATATAGSVGAQAHRSATMPALDRGNLDTTCAPCANFFRYANGGWAAKNPIPAAYPSWSGFNELTERNNLVLKDILESAARRVKTTRSPSTRKLGLFYATCMDSARAERDGAEPLKADLARIAAIHDRVSLRRELARLHMAGVGGGFALSSSTDPKNSTRVIAQFSQGGLGLPDRDYYLRTDSASQRTRADYVTYVRTALSLGGESAAQAESDAQRVMALETELAKASMTRVQLRDPNARYHMMPVSGADADAPGLELREFLTATGLAAVDSINVEQPGFATVAGHALADRPLEDWRAYLAWRLIRSAAPWLSAPFAAADFRFTSSLSGTREMQPRWKRCLRMADTQLGDALGQEYVKTTFTPAAKARLLDMVANMRAVMRERIGTLAWMSDATRTQALAKLGAFGQKVGYPEKWKSYAELDVTPGAFVTNLRAAAEYRVARDRAKVGKPVDRTEWGMTPPTVNAYYSPQQNEIAFPAGRVQPPFFHVSYDDAANYGGIGGTIGHEMTHGFDDQGRQYDAQGNLRDWWAPADAAAFAQRAAVVERQYSAYTVLDSLHVNGKLTLGENLADVSGMTIAFYALQRALKGKARSEIDGFTPEQRFFLAYAQARRAEFRPEQLRLMVQTDPHSPNEFRVNGPLSNMPEFRAAFACKGGDAMVRPDSIRAQIW